MAHRILVDFNTADLEGRIHLPTHVNPQLLEILHPRLQIIIYEPFDFEVEAVVEYDATHNAWYGRPDWSTYRNLESDALHGYWDVTYRIKRWREKHGENTAREAVLRQEAIALWKQLTDEERAYLADIPSVASYGQSPTESD